MINNNALADRLNAYKKGEILPAPESIEEYANSFPFEGKDPLNFKELIINNIVLVLTYIVYTLSFGYGAKTLFNTDWNFLGMFAIGSAISILIFNLYNIFTERNK
jgi:hypothetical protein